MLMVNLADLCNDRNRLRHEIENLIKDFCDKYQMHPSELDIEMTESGSIKIVIKV